ncbi:NADH dehydrogenase I chain J [Saccharopolyspora erythraea NRRL 2338]|uniref:NADH-quinone oxidoreductase subunit J n=2 Tax=Saccharopolyspora erythraea TaxID=1836 RepID=A4FPT2_SACEN|nr:NADH:ubiquinone oxidoreductase subunit J [Saccharopolyspora erythraea D]CAM06057.1 NADH dehydrogenase I chain J [Saccharopolyspora erythraea NRRL 2338]
MMALAAQILQQTQYLAQTQAQDVVGTGEAVVFWTLGPLALLGAMGMVFARNAVHSALWLVLTMLCLGVLYMAQSAPFLGFTQIIVYTGAIMMLFLFVLMMVGRDSSDSVVEVLRGQRLAAALAGVGFAVLLVTGLARSLTDVPVAAPLNPWSPQGGGAGGLGRLIFTDYLFPFELTSALLITAALGAMVLAYGGKGRAKRLSQRDMADARFRSARVSPLPGPGVYATANSVATPALLPDGSVAPESLSELLDNLPADRLRDERRAVSGDASEPGPRALTGEGQSERATTPERSEPEHTNGDGPHPGGGNGSGNGNGKESEQASTEEVRR